MKILKIERGNGYYLSAAGQYTEIDKITKEHLLELINTTLDHEVTFAAYDEQSLHNQAQRIIYRNILEKLQDLASRRQEFKDESDKWYEKEYERYAQPVTE
jgi:Na+-transporting NADH:ubiquinone oxidoreductase subunit NqrA